MTKVKSKKSVIDEGVFVRHSVNCARVVRHIRCLFFRSLVVASEYLVHETVCSWLETWHAPRLEKSHVSISSHKILLKYGSEKVSNWECLFVHREKRLFLSVHVDDIKLAGKKQNINPMWYVLNKEVDLGEPTSFLDHEKTVGCTQRQCEINKDSVDNYRTMFESRISAGATENYHAPKIWTSLHGPMTWKVMLGNVWNDIVS